MRLLFLATTVVVVLMASASGAAAVIGASPVRAGESSATTIDVFTSQQPSFTADPPPGLTVSFSPANEVDTNHWRTSMTIAAATSVAADTYSFGLTVTSSAGVLYTDTVRVEVLPAVGGTTSTTTTTSSTTTSTTPPPTTATTPPSTTSSTTTTTSSTTTSTTSTTSTTTTTTTSTSTTTTTTTTVPPEPSTTIAQAAPQDPTTTLGAPGAVVDPDAALPLPVLLPLSALALVGAGWLVVSVNRRRRFTPASQGKFGA